ncbi:MAG: ABC transporter permease [Verrucomicrobiales bacterium]|nr:ABC transporter permease [Verrucomicrobiales bacterium]
MNDLRFACRQLLKNPAFTAVAVLTLALGIGANTAIFSVVNAVLLKPLPYPHSERLISRQGWAWLPVPVFEEWRSANQTCDSIAGFFPRDLNLAHGGGEAEYVEGVEVSAEFFRVLQTGPSVGRAFVAGDFPPGHSKAAILSHRLWQRRFNGDPNVLGHAITLDGESVTIVGVMPEDFRQFPLVTIDPDVWTPLARAPYRANGEPNYLVPVARLKPESTIAQAQAEIVAVAERVRSQQPRASEGPSGNITLGPLQEQLVQGQRRALLLLFAAVGMVLLIACVNLAGMLLARGAARQKEFGIRAALGAGRLRLTRQLLTESLLLAGSGGVAGVLMALWGLEVMKILIPTELQHLGAIAVDHTTLGFGLLISLLTGVIFGLAPALAAASPDLNATLKEGGGKATAGVRRHRWLRTLVVSEIALALTLLVGAGLVFNSFVRLVRVEPGFNPDRTLTMRLRLPDRKYQTMAEIERFYTQLLARLSATPGVAAAALANNLPISRSNSSRGVSVEGQATAAEADFGVVSEDYFRAIELPLVQGRAFAASDTRHAPGVAIVDQSFAREAWPGNDALGKRIKIGAADSPAPWLTVVGVARDARTSGLAEAAGQGVYIPYTQRADTLTEMIVGRNMRLMIRAAGDPFAFASAVRTGVQSLDPNQSVTEIRTMEQVLADSISQPRFRAILLGLFAVLSMALAGAGIYGVISFGVAERTREFGIRLALGARPADVFQLVVRNGMWLALMGALAGLFGALALTRLLRNLLYKVSPIDPLTFSAASVLLMFIVFLACWLPARRAARVDPMEALRTE